MRLIGTIDDPKLCETFSAYLESKGIEHQIEVVVSKDWGSEKYGNAECQIWVVSEEYIDQAIDDLEEFRTHPEHEKFQVASKQSLFPPELTTLKPDQIISSDQPPPPLMSRKKTGAITKNTIILCVILFILSMMTSQKVTSWPAIFPGIAVVSSPINKALLYDWPEAYTLTSKIVGLYGIESFENPQKMPREEKYLIQEYLKTSYWKGFYGKLQAIFGATKESPEIKAPLFEKIRQGQFWRLITPVLLHADIFHILFNMLWLYVLGIQIEDRMSAFRFILFMLIIGIVSNTFQYLMSGPNFLGFSGILCGMLGFIWIRQKQAPWEGYVLQPGTLLLLSVFILALFAIQVVAFGSQIFFGTKFTPNIANTAHLTGAATGILLGQMSYFSWQKNR